MFLCSRGARVPVAAVPRRGIGDAGESRRKRVMGSLLFWGQNKAFFPQIRSPPTGPSGAPAPLFLPVLIAFSLAFHPFLAGPKFQVQPRWAPSKTPPDWAGHLCVLSLLIGLLSEPFSWATSRASRRESSGPRGCSIATEAVQSACPSPHCCAAGRLGARARRGNLAKQGCSAQRVPVAALRGGLEREGPQGQR